MDPNPIDFWQFHPNHDFLYIPRTSGEQWIFCMKTINEKHWYLPLILVPGTFPAKCVLRAMNTEKFVFCVHNGVNPFFWDWSSDTLNVYEMCPQSTTSWTPAAASLQNLISRQSHLAVVRLDGRVLALRWSEISMGTFCGSEEIMKRDQRRPIISRFRPTQWGWHGTDVVGPRMEGSSCKMSMETRFVTSETAPTPIPCSSKAATWSIVE